MKSISRPIEVGFIKCFGSSTAIKTLFNSGQLIGCFIPSLIGVFLRSKVIMVGGIAVSLIGSVMIALSDILWL